jgi:hypothetical protein
MARPLLQRRVLAGKHAPTWLKISCSLLMTGISSSPSTSFAAGS